jgi:molybdate transport system ATP-binding protein
VFRSYIRNMATAFLTLGQVSVRIGNHIILDHLDLSILRGEHWAITGPSGSGKTTLAHTLMGRHFYSGRIRYHFGEKRDEGEASAAENDEGGGLPSRIAMVEQQHRFKGRPGTTDLYYQQRFNASDADQTMTVEQELQEYGFDGTGEWMDTLQVLPLLSKPLIQLSNGENKRVQLAIALLNDPELLILDNPFLGLDTEGRATLRHIIDMLAGKGIQILLITSVQELPAAITHVARLEEGRWVFSGPRADLRPMTHTPQPAGLDHGILARLRQAPGEDFSVAVKMVNVTIKYGDAIILNGINWEVRNGEKWSLSGPNGAGKSTILSLITADNPQAYANEIWLFDRRRGSGESIWDIKQKIGFVSPELHLFFEYGSTCFEVVASGLFDTIGLFRPLTTEQQEHTRLWMELLSLGGVRSERLARLSTGQQRMVLLGRALVKNPPMLILDEPCQGLDEEQTQYFRKLISLLCEAFGTTLIYVSHYREELPDCIDRFLVLQKGMIVT